MKYFQLHGAIFREKNLCWERCRRWLMLKVLVSNSFKKDTLLSVRKPEVVSGFKWSNRTSPEQSTCDCTFDSSSQHTWRDIANGYERGKSSQIITTWGERITNSWVKFVRLKYLKHVPLLFTLKCKTSRLRAVVQGRICNRAKICIHWVHSCSIEHVTFFWQFVKVVWWPAALIIVF